MTYATPCPQSYRRRSKTCWRSGSTSLILSRGTWPSP
jgi:hypothetical protein